LKECVTGLAAGSPIDLKGGAVIRMTLVDLSKKKSKELKQAVKDALNVKVNSGDKLVPIKVTDDIRSLANKTHITRWLTAVNDVIEKAKEKKVPESTR
jgi:hypothetical protein